jgi:hypothetical protein
VPAGHAHRSAAPARRHHGERDERDEADDETRDGGVLIGPV